MSRFIENVAQQHINDPDSARSGIAQFLISASEQYRKVFGEIDSTLPEGVIRLPDLTIGGKTPEELEKALGNGISDYARDLLRSKDFTTLPEQQIISPIIATPSVMGLPGTPTTEQIFDRADKLNWDLCPAEVGPHLVIAFNSKPTYKDLPIKLPISIGMKQITDRDGDPSVFSVEHDEDGLWLLADWAGPANQWSPEDQLVFSPRK